MSAGCMGNDGERDGGGGRGKDGVSFYGFLTDAPIHPSTQN